MWVSRFTGLISNPLALFISKTNEKQSILLWPYTVTSNENGGACSDKCCVYNTTNRNCELCVPWQIRRIGPLKWPNGFMFINLINTDITANVLRATLGLIISKHLYNNWNVLIRICRVRPFSYLNVRVYIEGPFYIHLAVLIIITTTICSNSHQFCHHQCNYVTIVADDDCFTFDIEILIKFVCCYYCQFFPVAVSSNTLKFFAELNCLKP